MSRLIVALALAGVSWVAVCTPSTALADKPLPVLVVNPDPIVVKDANNPERQPVTNVIWTGGNYRSYTVPSGKRLVIEHYSGTAFINGAGNYLTDGAIQVVTGGLQWRDVLPLTLTRDSGDSKSYVFAGMTLLYADEGTQVTASYTTSDTSAVQHVAITFTGYLVNTL